MFDTSNRDQMLGNIPHSRGLPANNQYFETVVVIQMHVRLDALTPVFRFSATSPIYRTDD
jgi:hypothetical protein